MDNQKLIRTLDAISYEIKLGKKVQFFTERDYIFNMWLHKYVYKYKYNEIGIELKELYDKGIISSEDDFKEELKKCTIY